MGGEQADGQVGATALEQGKLTFKLDDVPTKALPSLNRPSLKSSLRRKGTLMYIAAFLSGCIISAKLNWRQVSRTHYQEVLERNAT